jgi:hypothetical protein
MIFNNFQQKAHDAESLRKKKSKEKFYLSHKKRIHLPFLSHLGEKRENKIKNGKLFLLCLFKAFQVSTIVGSLFAYLCNKKNILHLFALLFPKRII